MKLSKLLTLLGSLGLVVGRMDKRMMACLPNIGWSFEMCQTEYTRAKETADACSDSSTFALNCCLFCYANKTPPQRRCTNDEGYTEQSCRNLYGLIERSSPNMMHVLYYLAIKVCFGSIYCNPHQPLPYPYTLANREELKHIANSTIPIPDYILAAQSTTEAVQETSAAQSFTDRTIAIEEVTSTTTVEPSTISTTEAVSTSTSTTTTTAPINKTERSRSSVMPEEMPAPKETFPGPSPVRPDPPRFIFPTSKKGILDKFLPGGEWFPIRFGRRGSPSDALG